MSIRQKHYTANELAAAVAEHGAGQRAADALGLRLSTFRYRLKAAGLVRSGYVEPSPDAEIRAMRRVTDALGELDPDACRRVIDWAWSRFAPKGPTP